MTRGLPAALAVALAFGATGACAQQLYKCLQGGKTVYQQEPCPEASTQQTLKTEAHGTAPMSDEDGVIEVMAGFQACSEVIPEYGRTHRVAYDEWRSRNAGTVGRLDYDPKAKAKFDERLKAARAGRVSNCVRVLNVIKPDRPNQPAIRLPDK
jgi:hypothetical protein